MTGENGQPNRRLHETAVFATLRERLRSGDGVERSANYRCIDSYLLPPADAPTIAAKLGLPVTADEWLASRGVELRDGQLHVASVKATTSPEAEALATRVGATLPHASVLHGEEGGRIEHMPSPGLI